MASLMLMLVIAVTRRQNTAGCTVGSSVTLIIASWPRSFPQSCHLVFTAKLGFLDLHWNAVVWMKRHSVTSTSAGLGIRWC
jgi:hypothetical protein